MVVYVLIIKMFYVVDKLSFWNNVKAIWEKALYSVAI